MGLAVVQNLEHLSSRKRSIETKPVMATCRCGGFTAAFLSASGTASSRLSQNPADHSPSEGGT
jgi:hypothetical protein